MRPKITETRMIHRSAIVLLVTNVATYAASLISITNPGPVQFAAPVTLTATVTPSTATGKATFYEGSAVLGTAAVVSGDATLHTKFRVTGTQTLSVHYSGDGTHEPAASTVSVTVSSGRSSAYEQPSLAVSGAALQLMGDFNGDGIDDLILSSGCCSVGGSIAISLGSPQGTFGPPTYFAANGPIALADFNLDGKLDLLAGTQTFLGNGDGTFQTAINSGGSGSIVADFNGDGIPDIAGLSQSGHIAIFLGMGDGTFSTGPTYAAASFGRYLACGDFNGDGVPDLAMTIEFNSGILIYLGNGDGTFTAGADLTSIFDPNFISAADFNNDGKTDLVVTNYYGGYGTVFLGRGDGTFMPPMSFDPGGTQPSQFTVVDLDGDGQLDLAVVNGDYPLQGNIGLLYGNGDGTFQPPVDLARSTGYFSSSILSGDFNGDGKVDLAVSSDEGVLILDGTASTALRVSMVPAGAGFYNTTIANAANGAPTSGPVLASIVQGTQGGGSGWTCSSDSCFRADALSPGASYPPIGVTVFSYGGLQSFASVLASVDSLMSVEGRVINTSGPCSLIISPPIATVPASGGAYGVNVTVQSLCSNFSFMSQEPWLTPPYGIGVYAGYVGTYSIGYWVEQNQSDQPRAGTISFANAIFTVVQEGAQPLQPVSVSPSYGNAGRQLFDFVVQDAQGPDNVRYTQVLFTKSGLSALNACYISYDPVANVFFLLSDDMTQWYGLLAGSANTIGNAQCEIHGATSGSSKSGDRLTVAADISFRTGFAGPKNVYQFSGDVLGGTTGWLSMASWVDGGDANVVSIDSLTPMPTAGLNQTLTATISDGTGANTISFVQMVVNSTLNGINACFVHYDRASNVFFLLNDSGTAWSGLLAGSNTSVSNSQCTLIGSGSGGSISGSTLTITYALAFAPGFAGTRQVFMQALDAAGNIEVWHNEGSDFP